MPGRNLICWNALIGGYSHRGHADMALQLFKEMTNCEETQAVVPSYVTFVSVLTACSRGGMVKVFDSMRRKYGIETGAEHYACVVDMLGQAGLVECANEFIREMPIDPSVSVWGGSFKGL
ncbi:pentatricopeptide repeat-containing At4g14850 [Olea europaea subsp. europaea]|uniref:Pentatricopeptide repeat-containing At4g14850 n=1 Tax=Olea europaea subsp. europaea TaxID=158383 RepID=A0A8S0ULF8_OLEEU|nr:pentatricopeptide repeat-containing At4g14850 [Olea europaea subsp. europaea]